jgi:hypothetical protein
MKEDRGCAGGRRRFLKRVSLASLLAGLGLSGCVGTGEKGGQSASPPPGGAPIGGDASPRVPGLLMGAGALRGLVAARDCRRRRVSSYDRSGKNADSIRVRPGQTATLAQIAGAGCLTHLWFTTGHTEPDYLRKLVLRAYWDGETEPSIEVPLGDFFCIGHGRVQAFQSLPVNVVTGSHMQGLNLAGMNCFFPMPFGDGARLTLTNDGEQEVPNLYFYVDYEEYAAIGPETLRFHAQWRRVYPTPGSVDLSRPEMTRKTTNDLVNLDGATNYVVLEAKGRGHYVGCNLSVENVNPIRQTDWFGEGDDMIYIDGEERPSIIGTGTEDYFGAAWGFPSGVYGGPYHGVTLAQPADPSKTYSGKWAAYRFHVEDPITFHESIRVTIEHGHANVHSNDYASTAYWYQSEPHEPFPALPAVGRRLPLPEGESRKLFERTF